ncbi:hypothetical protein ACCUM_2012 [Candidatus Accumulibacter phosphatis]|uniref:Uncharacterized protein n=1 Tax=Candidatus Accumulibacter phosphatis TaxID=327160 RepID=A0A5S4F2W5_9PROT|nr:hypothetical protein ACCUM_2012 [Candidatus Accumulibacter phosphatis]
MQVSPGADTTLAGSHGAFCERVTQAFGTPGRGSESRQAGAWR